MTSHSETPSFGCGCGFIPPSTTNAQNIPTASTVRDLKGPTSHSFYNVTSSKESKPSQSGPFSFRSSMVGQEAESNSHSFCNIPSSNESKPSLSGPFSLKRMMVGQGAESNSPLEKPTFSFGVETSAPCRTPASTNGPFLTQHPKEGACTIMSISALPINVNKSHEELRLENYLSQGKVKEQDEMASKVTPYPVYPFIPIMMLPSMAMQPLVPNLNAAFNVAPLATFTGFPAGSYAFQTA